MKQYVILTTDPAADRHEWHCSTGIGFNSLGAAQTALAGQVEALRRDRAMADRMNEYLASGGKPFPHAPFHTPKGAELREWVIVETDFAKMTAGAAPTFLERLRWAIRYVFSGHKFRTVCDKVGL